MTDKKVEEKADEKVEKKVEKKIEKKVGTQEKNPLHGLTLKFILETLHKKYGWDGLVEEIPVNCFNENQSINSSLKFLRTHPWARKKVERLYLNTIDDK